MILETPEQRSLSEREAWFEFMDLFCAVASFQGRLAYILMSIYAVNPLILQSVTSWDPASFLLSSMIFGIAVDIASRSSLRTIHPSQRILFGLNGSLALNLSSMVFYAYLADTFPDRPILRTILGFISGRINLDLLLAFLYHMDTRCNTPGSIVPRNPAYEAMYLRN